jgi:hypothetical protein
MDQLLEDYKSYYKARMDRYEGSELYKNSYASEKALYEAMASCSQLEEFKDKIGNLNIKNAIALVKDKELARKKNFEQMKETVRAKGPAEILENIDKANDINEVIRISNEIDQKNMVEISVDGFTDVFYDKIKFLEDIEIFEKAVIPDKWKSLQESSKKRAISDLCQRYDDNEKTAHQWKENWTFDYNLIWEERHRRKIPLSDEIVKRRIEETKKYRGK